MVYPPGLRGVRRNPSGWCLRDRDGVVGVGDALYLVADVDGVVEG